MIILYFYILDFVFDKRLPYKTDKFSLDQNLSWSPSAFIKRNFTSLVSIFLSSSNLGLKIFGPISYSKFICSIMGNYFKGSSVASIFWATKLTSYAIVGTYAFNCVVSYTADYLEYYSNIIDFSSMENILDGLNDKIDAIKTNNYKLIKFCICDSLKVSDTKDIKEEKDSMNEIYKNKLVAKEISKIENTILTHLSKLEDLSKEDDDKIELYSFDWIERTVNISSIENNGISAKDDDEKTSNNNYWAWIDVIKSK